ncbi:hypothetical protein BDV12DRAFT_201290 [Aspergillus spectabilis]
MAASPRSPPNTAPPSERRSSTNLFQCGSCSRSFTRLDHLGRHVRSHTQEKPYRCPVCNKLFGRVDLLSRHSALHDPQRESTSAKKRRTGDSNIAPFRASQACEACAEHHLRCDEEKPCRRCQRREILCTLPAKAMEYEPPTPPVTVASDRLEPNTSVNGKDVQGQEHQGIQVAGSLSFSDQLQSVDPGNLHQLAETPDALSGAYATAVSQSRENSLPDLSPITRGGLFSFGLETNLDLSMVDLSFLESYNSRAPFEYEAAAASTLAPLVQDDIQADHTARETQSVQRIRWRFVPAPHDHGYAEHGNLLLNEQCESATTPQSLRGLGMGPGPDNNSLDLSSRDKILSIVLSQMPQPFSLNAASFPSPELLDRLIRYFLTVPFSTAGAWIHRSTFSPKKSRPELLLAMAAAGAVLTPDSALRKLGFAMQEVVRHQLPTMFEADNTLIRDLELHQAFLLSLEISLWSGNSRKMEISESIRHPLITMLRRRGRFDAARYPAITVLSADTGQSLDDKWRFWVREESIKRLVYHLWQYDAQCSMVILTSPLISYAELSLPLPASPSLWNAPNAEQWRDLFCAQETATPLPPLTEAVMNMDLLEIHRQLIDVKIACTAVLHAIWGIIWEYRQMALLIGNGSSSSSISSNNNSSGGRGKSYSWSGPGSGSSSLLMASRYQQLTEMLNYFGVGYKNESALSWHSTLMHVHMSLEEIQVLAATLEQPETADQIPPAIVAWAGSKEGRQAVCHAARIIQELKTSPPQCLRDFSAVALYHATLALWAYGMGVGVGIDTDIGSAATAQVVPVWIDSIETDHIHRFISLGRGRPMMQAGISGGSDALDMCDPTGILNLTLRLMRCNHGGPDAREPPLVENLVHAVQKLLEVTTWSRQVIQR